MVERGALLLVVALRLPPLSLHVLASCDMPGQDVTDLHGAANEAALRPSAMKHSAASRTSSVLPAWCQLSRLCCQSASRSDARAANRQTSLFSC